MMNITEDYVSYETAKLLKEKGFEYNPDESYWLIDADNKMYWISRIGAYDYVDAPTESFQRPKNGYRLITQAMAVKWLREVHSLYIDIVTSFSQDGICYTFSCSNTMDLIQGTKGTSYHEYQTYEETCEAAIKYCLENLI